MPIGVAYLFGYLKSIKGIHFKSDNNSAIITLKTFTETNKFTVRY
ncbi:MULTISPECIES: hypothetical protein [unclassified Mucilaginibacter]|nr:MULTISPECIES: hypothetical protein [unclassified Mucilaginibacter]MEB0262173.1 hypothetical protein [Mucilaginibacter sp. 10I4]MEB0277033.1 hypothetical protein [Mucilaginibacter sp. 10B2]MEB0302654.1 hypothetical protein [Mucilaginibacter sp. 5C4]WPX25134.1 hypothetical protein RHM67_07625 [Mucilaginibacter sp. 5C4]